jgi:hypothetical protein
MKLLANQPTEASHMSRIAAAGSAIVLAIIAVAGSILMAPTVGERGDTEREAAASEEIGRSVRRDPAGAVEGHDVSWPNCPKGIGRLRPLPGLPLPRAPGRFVIVGLTEGPGFYPNPCLAGQVAWARRHQLATAAYGVVSYPTRTQVRRHGAGGPYAGNAQRAALRNTGFAQARVNLASMRRARLASPIVWIDVEPVRLRPWSANRTANRAVIEGAVRAYRQAGYLVGFYSYPSAWAEIVGDWRLPDYPIWATAGTGGRRKALGKCRAPGFAGGPVALVQWTDRRLDYNALCPGAAMADYFSPASPPP